MMNRVAIWLARSLHAAVVLLQRRRWAALVVIMVFAVQSAFGTLAGGAGPFALWPHTMLLLSPSFYWLIVGNSRNCILVTTFMGLLMCLSNLLGSLSLFGYVFAYWLGLPVSVALPWLVGRISAR